MRKGDFQLGAPAVSFRRAKSKIEALTGLVGGETAFSTDTGENGYYDSVSASWIWSKNPDLINGIQFDLSPTSPHAAGLLHWSPDDQTLEVGMGTDGVELQIGQETLILVKNQTGGIIENGQVVYYAGAVGASGRIKVDLAIADGTVERKLLLGIATQDIENGTDGFITSFGKVRGIDTTGSPYSETWADGDLIYLSPTINGGLTNIQPTRPDIIVPLAVVIYSHSVNGTLFVRMEEVAGSGLDVDVLNQVVGVNFLLMGA